MARVKINIPESKPLFTTSISLRIADMNYGNHLGNDRMLVIAQEVRVQWLQSLGLSELNIGGCGLIMADAMVVYKNEGLYGDLLTISLFSEDISNIAFDLIFSITVKRQETEINIAQVKTGMVGFDYENKKITPLPFAFKNLLSMK
jgi:acyl-CoA thioesterase FadM